MDMPAPGLAAGRQRAAHPQAGLQKSTCQSGNLTGVSVGLSGGNGEIKVGNGGLMLGNDGVKPGGGDGKAGSGGLIPRIGGDRGGNFVAGIGGFGFRLKQSLFRLEFGLLSRVGMAYSLSTAHRGITGAQPLNDNATGRPDYVQS